MKIVQINPYCGIGSTGQICLSISQKLSDLQIENYILFTTKNKKSNKNEKYYGLGKFYVYSQSFISKTRGNNGFNAIILTKRLISYLDEIVPDVVHLHNLHAQNVNITMLCDYLKNKKIQTVITMHDCWLITGYCPHFDMLGCDQWKKGCLKCKYHRNYSWFIDRSSTNYQNKLNSLSGLNAYVITPSIWMKKVVEKSPLVCKTIQVIHNGVDLDVFYPRKDCGAAISSSAKIVLAVADRWNSRKGIDVVIKIAQELPPDYSIVLVGTDDKIDRTLPDCITSIHRTQNKDELAKLYSRADVFINPTREEVLGLVNIESLACGTPVITFNTGGSPECINAKCGIVVEKNDITDMIRGIKYVCENHPFSKEDCLAQANKFSKQRMISSYLKVYDVLTDGLAL